MRPNRHLLQARLRKGWTLEVASAQIGVTKNTLNRWELGKACPRLCYLETLRKVYDASDWELGLEHVLHPDRPPEETGNAPGQPDLTAPEAPASAAAANDQPPCPDLEVRLLAPVLRWNRRHTNYAVLQGQVVQQLRSTDAMTHSDPNTIENEERRKALRVLASLPIQTFGLTALGSVLTVAAEELLPFCATGLTACWQLSWGRDLPLVQATLSAYLPTLTTLARQPARYQRAAAGLAAQAYLLKSMLGLHLESLHAGERYGMEALKYSKIAKDPGLEAIALRRLGVICYYDKRPEEALAKAQEALFCLKAAPQELIVPLHYSDIHAWLATVQAQNGLKQEALRSLGLAHESFFKQSIDDGRFLYADFTLSSLTLWDGTTYYELGRFERSQDGQRRYSQALDSFRQIGALRPSPDIPERRRIEFLNNRALAALRLNDLEEFQACMQAAIPAAMRLGSKRRKAEQQYIFDLAELVWPDAPQVEDLRQMARGNL